MDHLNSSTSSSEEQNSSVEHFNHHHKKYIFFKTKYKTADNRIYSVLVWEGTIKIKTTQAQLFFDQVSFALSSFSRDYVRLKEDDSVLQYMEAISKSKIETIASHARLYSDLKHILDQRFNDFDFIYHHKYDFTDNSEKEDFRHFKPLINEVSETLKDCYDKVSSGISFSLDISHEFQKEKLNYQSVINAVRAKNEEEKTDWQISKEAVLIPAQPIIELNKGIPSHQINVGDYLFLTKLSQRESEFKEEYGGPVKQILKGKNFEIKILVDLEENNFGVLELYKNMFLRGIKKDQLEKQDDPQLSEIDSQLDQEMAEPSQLSNSAGYLPYLFLIAFLVILAFFFYIFLK